MSAWLDFFNSTFDRPSVASTIAPTSNPPPSPPPPTLLEEFDRIVKELVDLLMEYWRSHPIAGPGLQFLRDLSPEARLAHIHEHVMPYLDYVTDDVLSRLLAMCEVDDPYYHSGGEKVVEKICDLVEVLRQMKSDE